MPLLLLIFSWASLAATPLKTTAELSGYQKTGRYDEVVHLCRAFATRYSKRVTCENFGLTPQGRNLLYLVASDDGALTPKLRALKKRPVLFFQGGIHAGEIDGKDAGFEFLRDVLDGKILKGILKQVTLVFVPVFNVDGHERFGPHQRPNQNGPMETGWRTTTQNLNLNRDYVKADASEMRDLLKLLAYWDPEVYVDLHVTDGAKFQHDVAIMIQPKTQGALALRAQGQELSDFLMKRLGELGHLPLSFYPSFKDEDRPDSGFETGVAPPRFSHGYWAEANRLGVLVEMHSWRDYAHRVRTAYDVLLGLSEKTALSGARWRTAERTLDAEVLAGKPVELAYSRGHVATEIHFQGYHYTTKRSAISGGNVIEYDSSRPEAWKVPLFEKETATVSVTAPKSGYLVAPADADEVANRLQAHSISFRKIKKVIPDAMVEVFRAEEFEFDKDSLEGHQRLTQKGKWASEKRTIEKGSLWVPIAQPRAKLLMHLMEPMAPDSLASWGFFNSHYEKKEYLETYLAEAFAADQIKEPAVRHEFEAWQKQNPEKAKVAARRLEFFIRRHPSFDRQLGVYPIMRTDSNPL